MFVFASALEKDFKVGDRCELFRTPRTWQAKRPSPVPTGQMGTVRAIETSGVLQVELDQSQAKAKAAAEGGSAMGINIGMQVQAGMKLRVK